MIAALLRIMMFAASAVLAIADAAAHPGYARLYQTGCPTCHSAVPRLNAFGTTFAADGLRLTDWQRTTTLPTEDPQLSLPKNVPIAFRAQGYAQIRRGEQILDRQSGAMGADADIDIQAPYRIRLLSGTPLADELSYYFSAAFAERGANGEVEITDAWLRYDDPFGPGTAVLFGQFAPGDLMFRRNERLTFQDFLVNGMAGLTYDRGLLFVTDEYAWSLAAGLVNGNGNKANAAVNSPGAARPDRAFDNNTGKSLFVRLGLESARLRTGLFALSGDQLALDGATTTTRYVTGGDVSGDIDERIFWYAAALWNQWLDFDGSRTYTWWGGYAGMDYLAGEHYAVSLLYNYIDAGDFAGADNIYAGLAADSITTTLSYYLRRNVRLLFEINMDFLPLDADADFVGHENKEDYVLMGFDLAF